MRNSAKIIIIKKRIWKYLTKSEQWKLHMAPLMNLKTRLVWNLFVISCQACGSFYNLSLQLWNKKKNSVSFIFSAFNGMENTVDKLIDWFCFKRISSLLKDTAVWPEKSCFKPNYYFTCNLLPSRTLLGNLNLNCLVCFQACNMLRRLYFSFVWAI